MRFCDKFNNSYRKNNPGKSNIHAIIPYTQRKMNPNAVETKLPHNIRRSDANREKTTLLLFRNWDYRKHGKNEVLVQKEPFPYAESNDKTFPEPTHSTVSKERAHKRLLFSKHDTNKNDEIDFVNIARGSICQGKTIGS